jgi:hypothetical protein
MAHLFSPPRGSRDTIGRLGHGEVPASAGSSPGHKSFGLAFAGAVGASSLEVGGAEAPAPEEAAPPAPKKPQSESLLLMKEISRKVEIMESVLQSYKGDIEKAAGCAETTQEKYLEIIRELGESVEASEQMKESVESFEQKMKASILQAFDERLNPHTDQVVALNEQLTAQAARLKQLNGLLRNLRVKYKELQRENQDLKNSTINLKRAREAAASKFTSTQGMKGERKLVKKKEPESEIEEFEDDFSEHEEDEEEPQPQRPVPHPFQPPPQQGNLVARHAAGGGFGGHGGSGGMAPSASSSSSSSSSSSAYAGKAAAKPVAAPVMCEVCNNTVFSSIQEAAQHYNSSSHIKAFKKEKKAKAAAAAAAVAEEDEEEDEGEEEDE